MHLHVTSRQPDVTRGADSTVGVVVFSDQLPDLPEWATASDPPGSYAVGRFQIDLDTVFGIPSTGESPADFTREVLARVRGDSIWMSFTPQAADAGLGFRGVLRGDSVTGQWLLHGYAPRAHGAFRMYRVQKTAIFDSLVTQGREATYEEDKTNGDESLRVAFREDSADVQRALHAIEGADAVADARQAIERGDLRFLAVGGYAESLPGVDSVPDRSELVKRAGGKPRLIEGTGGGFDVPGKARLNELAVGYASAYNRVIADRLRQ
jgi:hypothetical protein